MKVLLAVDGSPHSHAALVQFAKQPWPKGTEVQILTVIHPSIPLFIELTLVIAAAHVEEAEELRKQAPALVEAASRLIRDAAPAVTVTTKILEGVPKDMIVQEANDWGADLIGTGFSRLRSRAAHGPRICCQRRRRESTVFGSSDSCEASSLQH